MQVLHVGVNQFMVNEKDASSQFKQDNNSLRKCNNAIFSAAFNSIHIRFKHSNSLVTLAQQMKE
jgi:hypothetical protein